MIGKRIEWIVYGCVFRGTVHSVFPDDRHPDEMILNVLVDVDTIIVNRDNPPHYAAVFPPGHPDWRTSRWLP